MKGYCLETIEDIRRLRKVKEKTPPVRAGMNPTRSCHSLIRWAPEFPRRDTSSMMVQTRRVPVSRGTTSDTSPRRPGVADANRGAVLANYPSWEDERYSSRGSADCVSDGRPH